MPGLQVIGASFGRGRTWMTRRRSRRHRRHGRPRGPADLDPPQLDEARTWYERAAEPGDTDAMLNLGALLANEVGPPQLDEARTWWTSADQAGHAAAMSALESPQ